MTSALLALLLLLGPSFPSPSYAVTIAWNKVVEDLDGDPATVETQVPGYRVYLVNHPAVTKADFGDPYQTVFPPTTPTWWTPVAYLSPLVPGTTYWLAVTAFDGSGNESDLSQIIQVQLPPDEPTVPPACPTGLKFEWRGINL